MNPHDIANAELIELLKDSLDTQAMSPVEADDQEKPEELDAAPKNEPVTS